MSKPMKNYPSIKKAIACGTKAVEEDKKRNYEKATQLYEQSVAWFLRASQSESKDDEIINDAITKKSDQYKKEQTNWLRICTQIKPCSRTNLNEKRKCDI